MMYGMNPYVSALRAITGVFFRQMLRPVLTAAVIFMLLIYVLIGYLASIDGWWLLLLLMVLPATILMLVVGSALWFLSGRLLPRKLTRDETRTVAAFSDKLARTAGTVRTPLPVLGLQIAKDVLKNRGSNALGSVIHDSTSLKKDFDIISHLFAAHQERN